MRKIVVFWVLTLFFCVFDCSADTFTHKQSGEVLHGYATSREVRGETIVHTAEKGIQRLALGDYQVKYDCQGRQNKVVVLGVNNAVELEVEAEAIAKAIVNASNKGPLFIILQLDASGGEPSVIKRVCAAITGTRNCPVYAFVGGGESKGVYGAVTMLALACDRIYIAPQANIGAAKVLEGSVEDVNAINVDLRERFGESVGEKFASAYRAYVAALAEQNDRPGLLAMAMVDRDIEVLEVAGDGGRAFIEPVNKRQGQSVARIWAKKGMLLTLSAQQAVQCKMAEGIAASQGQLIKMLGGGAAEIVYEDSHIKVRQEFEKARKQFEELVSNIKTLEKKQVHLRDRRQQMRVLMKLVGSYKQAVDLAEHNPDLNCDIFSLKTKLNTAQGKYQQIKSGR